MAASMRIVAFSKSRLILRYLGGITSFRPPLSVSDRSRTCSVIWNSRFIIQSRSFHVNRPCFTADSSKDNDAEPPSSSSSSSSESESDTESPGSDVKLQAQPKNRKLDRQRFNEANRPHDDVEKPFADKVLSAVEAVGKLTDDPDQTVNELLNRLQAHSPTEIQDTEESISPSSLGDLLSSMKMEEKTSKRQKDQSNVMEMEGFPGQKLKSMDEIIAGARLNIFDGEIMRQQQSESLTPLMRKLGSEELEMFANFPPSNAFQEMIKWTKEGKMWHFPIDNEQGLDDEGHVPFTEHVFLDHLIEDFPKRGPIRHFMELVVVALSKNPYLTVEEKHDQVQWFRDYFKDKMHLVEFADIRQDKITQT